MKMDGDLILIKLVRNRRILWDKNSKMLGNANKEKLQENAWTQVAEKIGAETDWIKARWKALHDCFMSAYQSNNDSFRSKFRYYNEMLFIIPTPKILNENQLDNWHSLPEFIITSKELEETTTDDSENIFIEFQSDGDEIEQTTQQQSAARESDDPETIAESIVEQSLPMQSMSKKRPIQQQQISHFTTLHADEQTMYHQTKKIKQEIDMLMEDNEPAPAIIKVKSEPISVNYPVELEPVPAFEPQKPVQPVPVQAAAIESNVNKTTATAEPTVSTNERDEDTIFGELVTAMIRGMPEAKKKQVKKEIMNVLLS